MLLLEASDAGMQAVTLLIAPHSDLCDVLFPIMSTLASKIYHLFIKKIYKKAPHERGCSSGERGIRTLGDISATFDFESSALDQLSHLSMLSVRRSGGIMSAR